MSKRFMHPLAFGGYGTIILTIVIFFAQGGFGDMTPLTSLYIIGLIIGIGLILYSVLKTIPNGIICKTDDGTKLLRFLDEDYQRLKLITGRTINKLRNNRWKDMQPIFKDAMDLTQMDIDSKIRDIMQKGITDFMIGKPMTIKEESEQLGADILKSPLFTTNPEIIAKDASILLRDQIPSLNKAIKHDSKHKKLIRQIERERDKFPSKSISDEIDAYLEHSIKINTLWILSEHDLDALANIENMSGQRFPIHFMLQLKNLPNQMDVEMGQYRNKVAIAISSFLKEGKHEFYTC